MSDQPQVIQSVINDISKLDELEVEANKLIAIARDAGEDVSQFETELKVASIKKAKWNRSIKEHTS